MMTAFDDESGFVLGYRKAVEIEAFALAVIAAFPEDFDFLQEIDILYLFTSEEIRMQGMEKSAFAGMPNAMGQNRKIMMWALSVAAGFTPEAFVVVSKEQWDEMPNETRIMLMYHELAHFRHKTTKSGMPCYTEDGMPVIETVGHAIEEHFSVAEKFGLNGGIRHAVELAKDKSTKVDCTAIIKEAVRIIEERRDK